MNKLKSCPFCSKAMIVRKRPWWFFEYAWVQIQCSDIRCGTCGPKHQYEGITDFNAASDYAINEWNRRI